MADSYTSATHEGYFSRIGGAFVGVLVGMLLVVIAFFVLFLNEGRAVRTAKTLAEGAAAIVDTDGNAIDPTLDGKLVHITGSTSSGQLSDQIFNVSADAAKLNRVVEVYQWKENKQSQTSKDIVGGGTTTTTTYTYQHVWSGKLIDSSGFHDSSHPNPASQRISDLSLTASNLAVGPYGLSEGLIRQIAPLERIAVDQVPAQAPAVTVASDGGFYVGASSDRAPDPASPQVGDLKISFLVARSATVSIVAMQSGRGLAPYIATTGKTIEILKPGIRSHQQMFAEAVMANRQLTWILRGVGFIVMTVGFLLILGPLKVIADVVGFVGDIVGMGVGLVSLILGVSLSLITIAAAWLVYRPFLGVVLLALAGALVFWLTKTRRNRALAKRGSMMPVA